MEPSSGWEIGGKGGEKKTFVFHRFHVFFNLKLQMKNMQEKHSVTCQSLRCIVQLQ